MMIQPIDPRPASGARVSGSAARDDAGTIESAYRLLMIRGLSSVEAGNIVAYVAGLHAAQGGWTVDEIKHLVAIRSMVQAGVIDM